MVSLVIKHGKTGRSNNGFSPAYHVAHRLTVILVGDLEINRNIMLRIHSGLYVIGHLCNVVTGNELPTVGV